MLDLFVGSSAAAELEQLPCRQAQVDKGHLATLIFVATFAFWAEQDCVRLAAGTRGLLKKTHCVLARRTDQPAGRLDGVEGKVLLDLTGRDEACVGSVVSRVLRLDSVDPWGAVCREVQHHLAGLGYASEVRHPRTNTRRTAHVRVEWVPRCEKIAPLEPEAFRVRDMLLRLRASSADAYGQLWSDVAAGIASRHKDMPEDLP